LVKPSID